MVESPRLAVVTADATSEEVAAIVAAVGQTLARAESALVHDVASRWVAGSRFDARRTGTSRGDWRYSARIGRRAGT